jgi:HlyD family secretion protein
MKKQKSTIESEIVALNKNLEFLNQELIVNKNLLEKGLITKPQVIATERQIDDIINNVQRLNASVVQINSQELNNDFNLQSRKALIRQRINQDKLRLKQLEKQYDKNTNITSPHTGEVIELLTSSGIVVGAGSPLFKIKSNTSSEGNLRGVLYVPAQEGKKITVGMQALVVPSTVKPQEHGYIKATVKRVSEFPVTQQGMMASMQNDQLVNSMLRLGAPFEVVVEIERNAETPSGFSWTSAEGPDISINTGTSCLGKITVNEEAPIAMIVPAFKEFFDLY